jgi:DNA-binding LacI/PurR family transcriptional regulator
MDIYAVAQLAGVSTATVSRVLNDSDKVRQSTAERVRKAVKDLGYRPNTHARSLRSGRSNLFGIIVSDIRNPFFPDLIEHFESLAGARGIDVIIANTGYSGERLLASVRRLVERGVDGIAILTSEVSEEVRDFLQQVTLPVVFLNQPSTTADYPNITVDYVRGYCDAVRHLCLLGHQDIGFIAGPPGLSSAVRRRKAFQAAVRSCRIVVHKEWLFEGNHQMSGGQAASEAIFGMAHRPSAVVCSNDMTAIGVLHAAQRMGHILPDELSLIGFDDLSLCEIVHPALTTLHLSRQQIASKAFSALYARLRGDQVDRSAAIEPTLVVRASTGPLMEGSPLM